MTNRNESDARLTIGESKTFRFRINWSEQTPATNPPILESLKFGDVELC